MQEIPGLKIKLNFRLKDYSDYVCLKSCQCYFMLRNLWMKINSNHLQNWTYLWLEVLKLLQEPKATLRLSFFYYYHHHLLLLSVIISFKAHMWRYWKVLNLTKEQFQKYHLVRFWNVDWTKNFSALLHMNVKPLHHYLCFSLLFYQYS